MAKRNSLYRQILLLLLVVGGILAWSSAQLPRPNRPREFFTALNGIRFADQFPGATVGAQIEACLADIGPFADGMCVIPPSMGPGAPSSVARRHLLLDYRGPGFKTPQLNGTIIVDGNKYPQTEAGINLAILDASAGDTIILPPATYSITTGIVVNKQLRITGSPRYILGTGGAVLSGSGIAIMTVAAIGVVLDNFSILDSDPNGNANTIGIDMNNGATGAFDFSLSNLTIRGDNVMPLGLLGTGLRLEYGLKGNIENCQIEFWNKGISLNSFGGAGALRSNANRFAGNRIRVNTIGISVEPLGSGNSFYFANTIEANTTGVEIRSGQQVFLANHFEQEGGPGVIRAHIEIFAGFLSSFGNRYSGGVPANQDIIVDAGNPGVQHSSGDQFSTGITHNGTGVFLVINPLLPISIAGTGKVTTFDGDSLIGTNQSNTDFIVAGYSLFNIQQPIQNSAGDTVFRSSIGNNIRFKSSTGATRWTIDNANGDFAGAAGLNIRSPRYQATGTVLDAGDFALSSGWGTTATVSSVSGNDQRFRITVTSAGTGQTANPTITLTFTNGTWVTAAPFANVTRGGGSQPTVSVDVTSTTFTTLVITFNGTPVAAETYDINCIVMG